MIETVLFTEGALQGIKEYIFVYLENTVATQKVVSTIIKAMRSLEQFPDVCYHFFLLLMCRQT